MDQSLEARVRRRLSEWEEGGRLRTLQPPAGVDLSSNDYLNLSRHPLVVERHARAVAGEGCGSTGSRLLRGDRDAFHAIEQRMAALSGTERALYFSSGYLANIGTMSTMVERGDVVFSDERNHASLIDGMRLSAATRVVFPHNDAAGLRRLMAETPLPPDAQRFVVVESLFSMDGDFAPLEAYADLCRSARASLVVDEAHAVGVYGARGSGLVEELGLERDIHLSIRTAGKALGASGAFVCGPAWAIEDLTQRARSFVFSTAAPPALAAAIDAGLDVIAGNPGLRERLGANVRRLRTLLARAGLPVAPAGSQIISIVIGDNAQTMEIARTLQREGFDVRAIRPPTVPPGTARLRVSVNAGLADDTLVAFAATLVARMREAGLCSVASS
jgi:8-amino-7-oxononanoate synthase